MRKFAGLLVAGALAMNVAACTEDLSSLLTSASGTIDSLRHVHVEDSVRHAHDSSGTHDSGAVRHESGDVRHDSSDVRHDSADVRHSGSDDTLHVEHKGSLDSSRHGGGGHRGGDDGDTARHEGGGHH
jgi:hypothetical protein